MPERLLQRVATARQYRVKKKQQHCSEYDNHSPGPMFAARVLNSSAKPFTSTLCRRFDRSQRLEFEFL